MPGISEQGTSRQAHDMGGSNLPEVQRVTATAIQAKMSRYAATSGQPPIADLSTKIELAATNENTPTSQGSGTARLLRGRVAWTENAATLSTRTDTATPASCDGAATKCSWR